MKASYKKKQFHLSLIFGIVWIIIGIVSIVADFENKFMSAFNLLIGFAYLAIYFLSQHVVYVLITDEFIQVHNFTKKKILLKDILEVKYFAGDFTIKSSEKELTIEMSLVNDESLSSLKKVLEELRTSIKPSGTSW